MDAFEPSFAHFFKYALSLVVDVLVPSVPEVLAKLSWGERVRLVGDVKLGVSELIKVKLALGSLQQNEGLLRVVPL